MEEHDKCILFRSRTGNSNEIYTPQDQGKEQKLSMTMEQINQDEIMKYNHLKQNYNIK